VRWAVWGFESFHVSFGELVSRLGLQRYAINMDAVPAR